MPSLLADLLDRLDPERRYEFEERAGTIEFDSAVPRDEAEALALIGLLRTHPAALLGVGRRSDSLRRLCAGQTVRIGAQTTMHTWSEADISCPAKSKPKT